MLSMLFAYMILYVLFVQYICCFCVQEQLWNLDKTYERSIRLLEETKAAVEMQKYGAMIEFTGVDVSLV